MSQSNPMLPKATIKEEAKKIWYNNPRLRTLISGLVLSLPIIILLFLIKLLVDLIFGIISPISYLISPGAEEPHWIFHIISLIILLGIFYLVGLGTKNKISSYYFKFFEKEYLIHLPLYTTLRDLVQQFSGLKEMPFRQVVLIDPFESGVLMTGFVTEQVTNDIFTVFVPTAPNPTNGNIYHVPKSKLKLISATPDSAMRTIVGMGTGSTCLFGDEEIIELQEKNEET
jgi:uncharacterized membrane protein